MHKTASLTLAALILVASAYGIIMAWSWPWKAALFPLAIGIPLFCLAAIEALWTLFSRTARTETKDFQLSDHLPPRETLRRSGVAAVWIVGFFVAILLFGFPIAVALFVFAYLRFQGGESWLFSVVFTAATWGFFYVLFDRLLHLPFPAGGLF